MPATQPIDERSTAAAGTRVFWFVFAAWWTLLALLFAVGVRIASMLRERPRGWGDTFLHGFLDSYTWGLVGLAAILLAWRLPLDRGGWIRLVGTHLAAALILIGARLELFYQLRPILSPDSPRIGRLAPLVMVLPHHLMIYALLAAIGYALVYFQRFRERELTTAQLEAQLARAQLQVLTVQLQPRFLFSTLRAISAMMHRDLAAADRMLALLGDLLRQLLQDGGREFVGLKAELERLELYLEIEQARLGTAIEVEWAIDPETLEREVPHLLLQPLAEALLQPAADHERGLGIEIAARLAAERLELEIGHSERGDADRQADAPTSSGGRGVVIANTRARLSQLYGPAHAFEVRAGSGGRLHLRITLPAPGVEPAEPVAAEPRESLVPAALAP